MKRTKKFLNFFGSDNFRTSSKSTASLNLDNCHMQINFDNLMLII